MTIGTKTVLVGVHQFAFHPVSVCLAWRRLYKRWPNWRELIAIAFHDLGYCGKENLDGPEGKSHPYRGALWAGRVVGFIEYLLGQKQMFPRYNRNIFILTAFHSRDFAEDWKAPVSRLYFADKLSILYDPESWYLLRARLSGEIVEFKQRAIDSGHLKPGATDSEWYRFYKQNVISRPEIAQLLNK